MTILELFQGLMAAFPTYTFSLPPNLELGILTTNEAFKQAKEQKISPQAAAVDIAQKLQQLIRSQKWPIEVKIAGPYVNLDLQDSSLVDIIQQKQEFKLNQLDKKVLVDFLGLNVAKPMHAGHIRNANLGEALVRLLKLKYTQVVSEHYWGDWGVQFGILIWAWKKLELAKELDLTFAGQVETIKLTDIEVSPIDLLVKLYVWGNQQKDLVESWEDLVRQEFIKLEQGDSGNRALWQQFLNLSKVALAKDTALFNVGKFDLEQGESYYEGEMKILAEFMEKHNLWLKEGLGRYIDLETLLEKWPSMPKELQAKIKHFGRCYLVSTKGYTTYPFRDVAARLEWARDQKADIMITLTGNEQSHNFDQAFSIISYLASLVEFQATQSPETIKRLQWENLVHIGYGFLNLPEGKMSTRKGNFLTAHELTNRIIDFSKTTLLERYPDISVEELAEKARIISISALKWYDLGRDSIADITLDIPKILSFEGNTGVYQLYTLARVNSILEKNVLAENDFEFKASKLNLEESLILKQMYILPYILEHICENYKPHLLCNHLFDLATQVNSWYVKYSVSSEIDLERKTTLLIFCQKVKNHMWQSLELLGIEPVDRL